MAYGYLQCCDVPPAWIIYDESMIHIVTGSSIHEYCYRAWVLLCLLTVGFSRNFGENWRNPWRQRKSVYFVARLFVLPRAWGPLIMCLSEPISRTIIYISFPFHQHGSDHASCTYIPVIPPIIPQQQRRVRERTRNSTSLARLKGFR